MVAPAAPSASATPAAAAVAATSSSSSNSTIATRIAGLPILKGAVLYGATLTFAAFYAYFIYGIFTATKASPATFSTSMVSAAAALAGVLGSAFALAIGVPTSEDATNPGLEHARKHARTTHGRIDNLVVNLRRILSIDPPTTKTASWPMTFGIWMYAIVATAVAITYVLNQSTTPPTIRTLAIAFGGYAIALVTAAYGLSK